MIQTITNTIKGRYRLQEARRGWTISAPTGDTRLTVPDCPSFGFSLDNEDNPPLAFFSDSPPVDMAKMCDAIIALSQENKLYLFCIELKTGDEADYEKQLTNGRIFCEWLIQLYKAHDYWSVDSVHKSGLLIWEPQRSGRRGTTSHGSDKGIKPSSIDGFDSAFDIRNRQRINLGALLDLCE